MVSQVLSDRYEIIEIIGQGGMGVIYKARHLLMKRIVAIKMLHESLTINELARKRFEQEAQTISALNHPNILTVFDFGVSEDGKPYLVVEYLEGCTLEDRLTELGHVPYERAMAIFKQACAGFVHAHEKGVIHRDIKPSNCMLVKIDDQDDFVKIVDFGIAKLIQDGQKETLGLTTTGEIFGSPLYMSPEQCSGRKLDARSDIYSLGCVLYRTLTGQPPFVAQTMPECLYKHVHERSISFAEANADLVLPPGLEEIVFKAIAKDPDERYQSMAELKRVLETFETGAALIDLATSAANLTQADTNGQLPNRQLDSLITTPPAAGAFSTDSDSSENQSVVVLNVTPVTGSNFASSATPSLTPNISSITKENTAPPNSQLQASSQPPVSQTVPILDTTIPLVSDQVVGDQVVNDQVSQAASDQEVRDPVTLTTAASSVTTTTSHAAVNISQPTSAINIPVLPSYQASTTSNPTAINDGPSMRIPKAGIFGITGVLLVLIATICWYALQANSPTEIYARLIQQGNENLNKANYDQSEKSFVSAYQQTQKMPNGKPLAGPTADLLYKSYFAEGRYDKLAAFAMLSGQYDRAVVELNQALDLTQKKYGANSPQAADILSDLAKLYEKQGYYSKAEQFYTSALNIKSGKASSVEAISNKASAESLDKEKKEAAELKAHLDSLRKQNALAQEQVLRNQKVAQQARLQSKQNSAKSSGKQNTSAKANSGKTTSNKSGKSSNNKNPAKKKGIIKDVGHGFKKFFGIFGSHDKDAKSDTTKQNK